MADEKWFVDMRPRGAISYTRPDAAYKVADFNRSNTGPLKMTSRPPDDTVTKHSKGGMVKLGSPKISAPCRDTKTIKC